MTDVPPESGIDESPISPIERRNSLEKHLQYRPDQQDLKDRHILLDTNVAPYVIYPLGNATSDELAAPRI